MRRAVPVLLLAVVLTGCTSSDVPEESAFAEGTCRTAAPDVRAVGEVLPELGDGGKVADEVKDELREAQDRLAALADGAEPELQAPLKDLVEKLGIVRIRADGNTYEPELGEVLARSYERVLAACGAGSAG